MGWIEDFRRVEDQTKWLLDTSMGRIKEFRSLEGYPTPTFFKKVCGEQGV